jgi:ADP-heptose:LPS heptosyltransferase
MNILIAPWAKCVLGKPNPKNYPHWKSVVQKLIELKYHCLQISCANEEKICEDVAYDLPLKAIEMLIRGCDAWASVDSFLPHLAWRLKKPGVVVWGPSNFRIFGYPTNMNIEPKEKTTVPPFLRWDMVTYDSTLFAPPEQVVAEIIKMANLR